MQFFDHRHFDKNLTSSLCLQVWKFSLWAPSSCICLLSNIWAFGIVPFLFWAASNKSSTKLFCSSPPTTLLSNTPLICIVPNGKHSQRGKAVNIVQISFQCQQQALRDQKGWEGRDMGIPSDALNQSTSPADPSVFSLPSPVGLYTGSCTYSSTTSLQPPAVAMQIGGSPCDLTYKWNACRCRIH